VEALKGLPFDRNTNDFHFDTEIAIQLVRAKLRIKEQPIPTYYGDEIRRVNGVQYAFHVVKTTWLAWAQDLGILYQRKFDLTPPWGACELSAKTYLHEPSHSCLTARSRRRLGGGYRLCFGLYEP